jgi:glutathione S-transferase
MTTRSNPVLHGLPISPNVRAARLAFAERRVPITFEEIGLDHLATAEYAAINPFRKMPALRHGELVLYETPALMVYANGHGEGPSLEPAEVAKRATMWKFIGVAQNYLYPRGAMELAFHRVLAPLFGLPSDDAIAEAAAQATAGHLDVLASALGEGYLAGGTLSLADLYCGAMVDYVAMTREGAALVAARPRVATWLRGLRDRESFRTTFPAPLVGKAQT